MWSGLINMSGISSDPLNNRSGRASSNPLEYGLQYGTNMVPPGSGEMRAERGKGSKMSWWTPYHTPMLYGHLTFRLHLWRCGQVPYEQLMESEKGQTWFIEVWMGARLKRTAIHYKNTQGFLEGQQRWEILLLGRILSDVSGHPPCLERRETWEYIWSYGK